jgi:serine/threonine kinase PknH
VDEVAFGRYRLIALIGEGGMGKVYKAHDTLMGRDVAIKVLPPEMATEPGYAERFRREASTAARLTEPHIIPIYEAGEIDGRLYLVMPVIDGIDLHTELQRGGPMSPPRAVHVIEQLAAALNAAHRHGLVHRDIKPQNALLTGDDFVYLIDFGIVHDAKSTRLTSTGMMVGTFAYMAPERFTTGTADARADVYALACVLYECLTASPPYPGESMEQQITGHLTLDPPRPSERRPDIPAGFDEVIAAGMAKPVEERYQSARELATAARRALTEIPTPTREPHTAPAPFDDPSRPAAAPDTVWQPGAYPAQPAAQQRPPTGGAGWPYHLREIPPAYYPPPRIGTPPRARKRRPPVVISVGAVLALVVAATAGYLLLGRSHQPSSPSQQPSTTSPPVTTSKTAAPVADTALQGVLLSPDQINTAMGVSGMTVKSTSQAMVDYKTSVSDNACVAIHTGVDSSVYAGSGWSAVRLQTLEDAADLNHDSNFAVQAVVSFPSAGQAAVFFMTSAQRWPLCSSRQYTAENEKLDVGPVSNTDGTLSVTHTQENTHGWTCQRALTVSNNVAIDIKVCSYHPADSAVNIAHQIAAKVTTT